MTAEPIDASSRAVRCPVCSGTEHVKWRDAFDDRYGHPDSFALAHCRQCGHLMTLPRLREEDLPHLYGTYYPRKALTPRMVTDQAAQAVGPMARLSRRWMGNDNQGQLHVRPGEKMLDIGCGSGLSLLIARSKGAEAYGVEADPNVQVLAKELGLRIHPGSIHDHPFPGVSFDLVVLNQVIEHVPEPGKALEEIARRLAPGGRIILVFPNRASLWCRLFGVRWINWHVPYHLHHFDRMGFRRLVACHGLRMASDRTITPNLWTFLQLRVLMKRPIQGQPSPVWRVAEAAPGVGTGSAGKSFRQRVQTVALPLLLGGIGILNRCVDLLGQGDCLMVELKKERDL